MSKWKVVRVEPSYCGDPECCGDDYEVDYVTGLTSEEEAYEVMEEAERNSDSLFRVHEED